MAKQFESVTRALSPDLPKAAVENASAAIDEAAGVVSSRLIQARALLHGLMNTYIDEEDIFIQPPLLMYEAMWGISELLAQAHGALDKRNAAMHKA